MMWWLALATMTALPRQAPPRADSLDRVLAFRPTGIAGRPIAYDRGAVGTWHLLKKLQTTGSVLHTTAHPDDEHVGLLTRLSRGDGVRTALLALTRGEGGANAIGPELFDALGVVRSEELRLAGSYYGLDDLYFTTAIDYGYSKSLREARASWDLDAVLADMVRVIRLNRPLVVVSRFHGSERDGHGHHQAAGLLTPLAVEAAADPTRFPEQITREGLRPWRVRRLYRGGVRGDEEAHLTIEAGENSPWLGDTYETVGRYGVSLQRSQTAGRLRPGRGPARYRYERLFPPTGSANDTELFGDLNTSISGVLDLTGETAPDVVRVQLRELEARLRDALAAFSLADPAASVPALAAALTTIRTLLPDLRGAPDAAFLLRIKERQIERALLSASGIEVEALADAGPHGVATAGRAIDVALDVTAPAGSEAPVDSVTFIGARRWTHTAAAWPRTYSVTPGARLSVPALFRPRLSDNHYTVRDSTDLQLPAPPPALVARVFLRVAGRPVIANAPVRARVDHPPTGSAYPILAVLPAVSVGVEPGMTVVRRGDPIDQTLRVNVTNHEAGAISGSLRIRAPAGLEVVPSGGPFALSTPGERFSAAFRVVGPPATGSDLRLHVDAVVNGEVIGAQYRVLEHDDLERRYLDRAADVTLRSVDLAVSPGLTVGYIMGVGDEVPAAIEQLGMTVRHLSPEDLASADLAALDAIVIGTRAYAVRSDLVTHNQRLLRYADGGGHLVVLYQTSEFVPDQMAPFPATLPPGAEEVSEEDAPVRILQRDHPLLAEPNRIDADDFDGWVEQRGSKFFATWSDEYVPLIETHDTGQAPQRGVWLSARVGRGRYTYIALALHRQLPYGVPGAYRILTNLLAVTAPR